MQITNQQDIEKYYKALVGRDERFVGIFYVGVKTTNIFCIATCRARKPKLSNVEFYTTSEELQEKGFRPCKVCKPTQHTHEPPEYVTNAMELVKNNPTQKITNYQLKQQGLNPDRLRRWFQKHYGFTFQAYQRMMHINTAFQELKNGKNVTVSAFDSSYESLSGFGYTFKKLIGDSPKKSMDKNIIVIQQVTTPLGPMFAGATKEGLCLLEFLDRRRMETEFKDLQKLLNAIIIAGENAHTQQVEKELAEYFEGRRKNFEITLHTPGTEFQESVWNILQEIPYGETWSYQTEANKLNNPKGVRAVASANGYNRVSIVIPCHRVIGSDGSLTGYGGGIERKRWLLKHEKENTDLPLFA